VYLGQLVEGLRDTDDGEEHHAEHGDDLAESDLAVLDLEGAVEEGQSSCRPDAGTYVPHKGSWKSLRQHSRLQQ
jgi:hypothetical protein